MLSITADEADAVRNPLTPPRRAEVERLRANVIARCDDAYPPLLREIADPPLVLHVRGDSSLLAKPSIAIVGSRRASPYAINVAQHLSRRLVSAGLAVVSGLARGVDGAAHDATLEATGTTIAVLGTGIDVIYPKSHAKLYSRIGREGVIVSEFPPHSPPLPDHFPIRNRIISGLSLGTVIVEATTRSGSLITARMAAEQGREVFAIPGSIFSAGSEGTHRLIQYGAKLVHDIDDILDELPGELRARNETPKPPPDSPLREVLAAFTHDEGTHVDTVASRLARSPSAVAEALLQLELGGWIRALPGARYVRVK
ncbi:MAG TPA: DNA-processing protein DprA [Thermoanaerobaculia bacterium]|nr:DNA-processing protein DprA [Thermoanaerobaculia bacterium]